MKIPKVGSRIRCSCAILIFAATLMMADPQTEAACLGLKGTFLQLTDAQLAQLSKHLSGEAFDVQPVEKDADAIKASIKGLKGIGKFLDMEGGLVRWHAQF